MAVDGGAGEVGAAAVMGRTPPSFAYLIIASWDRDALSLGRIRHVGGGFGGR